MYLENNVFAKIIRAEIPCKKIYEDENILAFYDINPVAPIHILVIPKGHYSSFSHFVASASKEDVADFFQKVESIAQSQDLLDKSYRLIINNGSKAGQTVHHFHVHILAGRIFSE